MPEPGTLYTFFFCKRQAACLPQPWTKGWKKMEKKMDTITPEAAKEMLSNHYRDLDAIDQKMDLLYNELAAYEELKNDCIRLAALPARPEVMTGGGGGNTDNLEVMLRYENRKRERLNEIRMQMWILSEKAEGIRRLWNCFLALQEPYYGILQQLYVKKELYAAAQCSSGMSHRGFEQARKKGLEILAELYNSNYSALELMEIRDFPKKGQANKKKRAKNQTATLPGQIELPLDKL